MPKMKPDRDDNRGGLGAGGPQDGPIGGRGSNRQAEGTGELEGADMGAGAQRHPDGSSRDNQAQGS